MEMPVICKCGELVELNETRSSPLNNDLLCEECFSNHDRVNDLVEEGKTIYYDLENYEDYMKGDRRGWKKRLKEIKLEIEKEGFIFDDFVF